MCLFGITDHEYTDVNLIITLLMASLSHQLPLGIFYCSLDDRKYHQVCRTLLSILVNFNNAVFKNHFLISYSSRFLSKVLDTVSSPPTTTVLMFCNKLYFLFKSKYFLIFLFSSIFTQWSTWTSNSSLPYYLSIARERIFGCILYSSVLVLNEMQSRQGFEFGSPCPFPMTVTIIPLASPRK